MAAHIVVINHSPDLLEMFQDLLEYAGYMVTTQLFGTHTVAEVAQAQPAVLIVDYPGIQEPEAWGLIEQLHQDATTRHIPLVVSTTSPTLARPRRLAGRPPDPNSPQALWHGRPPRPRGPAVLPIAPHERVGGRRA